MGSKKWLKFYFLTVVIVVFLVGSVNYIVDPYGANNKFSFTFNETKLGSLKRPLHFKLPIVRKGNISNIMLGTSRIGTMKTEALSKYLPGNTFNLSSPGSLTDEQYYLLKYAIKFNEIKNVIYGLDFLSLNGARKGRISDYESISGKIKRYEEVKSDWDIYLSVSSLRYSLKMLYGEKDARYLNDGRRDYQLKREKIKDGTFYFKYNMHSNFLSNKQYVPYRFSNKKMEYVQKIIELCDKNNINLIIYIPPTYSEHFNTVYTHLNIDLKKFKIELSKISNYIDLSGINSISKNKNNYYDFSHLRDNLSEIVFSRIFEDKTIGYSKDFGEQITNKNVHKYLDMTEQQIQVYNLKKEK